MRAIFSDGWITIPYTKDERASIYIQAGGDWQPAFLDWDGEGNRITKVRPLASIEAGTMVDVQLRVNGQAINAGKVRIP
jgi:hypothetical protein